MKISCPHCNQSLEGDSTLINQQVNCPACHNGFVVILPTEKVCQFCSEIIKSSAIRCKYCQADLTGEMLKNGPTEVELTSKKYKKQILQGMLIMIISFIIASISILCSYMINEREHVYLAGAMGDLIPFLCSFFFLTGLVLVIVAKYRAWWHNG